MAGRLVSWLIAIAFVVASGGPTAALAQSAGGLQPDDFYAQILAGGGWKLISRQDVDLAGNGQVETLLLAIGTDCGSCHAKEMVLFSGTSPLGAVALDDPDVQVVPGSGIDVAQPVRLPDEPMCCPSSHYTLHFTFDTDAQTLVPDNGVTIDGGGSRAAVATYYQLMNGQWFAPAYGLLSGNMQQQVSYDDWLQSGESIQSVDAVQVDDVSGQPGNVRVKVQQQMQDQGGPPTQSSYSGIWSTVQEDGAWHLDHLSVSSAG